MRLSHFHKHHDYVNEFSLVEKAKTVMRLFSLLAVSVQSQLPTPTTLTLVADSLRPFVQIPG
jgi:hypothetical protein